MMICISCGINNDLVDDKSAICWMKKDVDGQWHWSDCHNVGGDINANKSIYD